MTSVRAALRWLHDPSVTGHPRYRAAERRQVLLAVRVGAITLAVVLVADSVLLFDEAPGLWLVNGAGAVGSLTVLWTLRPVGPARRRPVPAAFALGAIAIATTLVPIALIPAVATLMIAYLPIVIIASALFVPWTARWHVPWLVLALVGVVAFAASPFAGNLTDTERQEAISITITACFVSLAGHTLLQRERRRAFGQRMQLRGLHTTARHQRRELQALAAQLESVARRDPLTGIGNRLRLEEDVGALRRAVGRNNDRTAAAILLDIDHFKDYNDRNGHLAGDGVLREVARAIAINLRPQDRVYRFGGEEFLILLDGTGVAGALQVADRLRETIQALHIPSPTNVPWGVLTASAGVAAVRLSDGNDAWIREADERLYRSKAAGRNRVSGPDADDAEGSRGAAAAQQPAEPAA